MNGSFTESCGKFALGMAAGVVAGTALGMSMAPSRNRIKGAVNTAARRVNEAVDSLAEAMDM